MVKGSLSSLSISFSVEKCATKDRLELWISCLFLSTFKRFRFVFGQKHLVSLPSKRQMDTYQTIYSLFFHIIIVPCFLRCCAANSPSASSFSCSLRIERTLNFVRWNKRVFQTLSCDSIAFVRAVFCAINIIRRHSGIMCSYIINNIQACSMSIP